MDERQRVAARRFGLTTGRPKPARGEYRKTGAVKGAYRPGDAVVLDISAAQSGEMAEWPKAPDSKSGLGASPTWVRLPLSPLRRKSIGEMTEWPKVHDWKSCVPQGTQGSNPCLSSVCGTLKGSHTPSPARYDQRSWSSR